MVTNTIFKISLHFHEKIQFLQSVFYKIYYNRTTKII